MAKEKELFQGSICLSPTEAEQTDEQLFQEISKVSQSTIQYILLTLDRSSEI